MLGRVARLHYEHGFTHQQIADKLGLSRVKVTRLLAEARRTGVVEIRINSEETIFTDLEIALAEAYLLSQAWVAPTFEDPERLRRSLGTVAATALTAALRPGMTVAVGLSQTVAAIAGYVHADEPADVLFVPATGSRLGAGGTSSPTDVAQHLARAFRGDAHHLPAPVLATSYESARLLRQEPDVAGALARARRADLAVFGIGGMSPGSGLLMDGAVPPETILELVRAGAVGGISTGFFDANGQLVESELSQRIIGITLDELDRIPTRVAIAGGCEKRAAIRGALAGGHLDILVTDEASARELVEAVRN